MIYLAGPGHGGPALVAASYLEGTYTEVYPEVTQDVEGMRRLFRHLTRRYPEPRVGADAGFDPRGRRAGLCPGPRVRSRDGQSGPDRPRRGRRRRGGDRPAGGSWKGISFLNPTRDGAVLPILHLNGAKIAGPTVLARKDPAEVRSLLEGTGTTSSRSPATTCQGCTTGSPKPWRAPGRVSAVSRRLPVAAAGTVYAHGGR